MKKQTENLLYQLTHSEYCNALKEWFGEMVNENDIKNRSLDPNKEPHKISKLAGSSETLLSIIQYLEHLENGSK